MKTKKWFKTTGWLGIVACGLCCALPIIGATFGIGALTAFGAYFEKIGIVILGISAILLLLYFYQKRQDKKSTKTSCATDCGCKTETVK